MKWAKYLLKQNSPSFDFLTFMQMALTYEAEAVWFVKGYSGWHGYGGPEGEDRRFEEIVKPIVKLYGLPYEVSDSSPDGKEVVWPREGMTSRSAHAMGNLSSLTKVFPLMPSKEAFERIGNILKGERRLTFVCRNQSYQELRNTTEGQLRWAREMEAVILEDGKFSMDDRIAYYEHASLIVSSNGGNVAPAVFTHHRPYLLLKQVFNEYKATSEAFFQKHGIYRGFQYPFGSYPKQYVHWDASGTTYEDTCKAYETYKRLNDPGLS